MGLFVPPFAVGLKDRYGDMEEELLVEDKVNGYSCSLVYKGSSRISSKIEVMAKKDGKPVLTEEINIW